jgi:hypothetical protein
MINRGQIISEYIDREGINKSVLVKKIMFGGKFRTYRTLLNKLAEPNLSLDDVLSFSKALNHDFLNDIPDLKSKAGQSIGQANDQQEAYLKAPSDFKEKYYMLLEEQNRLLMQEKITWNMVIDSLKKLPDLESALIHFVEDFKKALQENKQQIESVKTSIEVLKKTLK